MDLAYLISGQDEEDNDIDENVISGEEELESWIGAALDERSGRNMFRRLGRARPGQKAPDNVRRMVTKIGRMAKAVQYQSGKIEAEYLRKPNNFCAIVTAALAPGASVAFNVQPGTGLSFYRLLSFVATDEQANLFGFTSLKVGGVEHVNYTQATPAAPVPGAVPWSTLALKEATGWAGIAPWSGQVFDSNVPITGTVANMTTAASIDTATASARLSVLTQIDPCGRRYALASQASASLFKSLRNNMGIYGALASR